MGENPEGLDYIFPRIGGLNPDGSPRRITNAFYTREIPMAAKHIQERNSVVGGLTQMLYNKMMFQPFVEMAQNKDYFGSQMYDEDAPFYKQVMQFLPNVLHDQLNPMSVSGAQRARQLSGKPNSYLDIVKNPLDRDVLMPFLGFGPAPGYASKSAMDNRIMYEFGRFVKPELKYFESGAKAKEKSDARNEYLGAQQKGDANAQYQAALKLRDLGVATKEIRKLQPGGSTLYMFQRLPQEVKKQLLMEMSPEEFLKYWTKTPKAVRNDPTLNALAAKYYAKQAQPQQGWGPPASP